MNERDTTTCYKKVFVLPIAMNLYKRYLMLENLVFMSYS